MKKLKGNIIIGQSGGPTAAINGTLAGIISEAMKSEVDIYGSLYGITGLIDDNIVKIKEHIKSEEDIEILAQTPGAFLKSCRYKLALVEEDPDVYKKIFDSFKKYDIRHFFYIGGNDSMDTVDKLGNYAKSINYDITIIGVPKTIDNDLAITDHSPGFGSAAKYVATTLKEIIRDTYSYKVPYILIIEVMGRNAGWLTAASALVKSEESEGVDLIYLPEIPFSIESFLNDIENLLKIKKTIVIAVSEGIKDANGDHIVDAKSNIDIDKFGHKALGGTSATLVELVKGKFQKTKTRAIEFSISQRCSSHIQSKTDITESFDVGKKAVEYATEEKTGIMIIYIRKSNEPYEIEIGYHDVKEIANAEKLIPRDWINDEGNSVNEKMIEYLRPLISGEKMPKYKHGLPVHLKI